MGSNLFAFVLLLAITSVSCQDPSSLPPPPLGASSPPPPPSFQEGTGSSSPPPPPGSSEGTGASTPPPTGSAEGSPSQPGGAAPAASDPADFMIALVNDPSPNDPMPSLQAFPAAFQANIATIVKNQLSGIRAGDVKAEFKKLKAIFCDLKSIQGLQDLSSKVSTAAPKTANLYTTLIKTVKVKYTQFYTLLKLPESKSFIDALLQSVQTAFNNTQQQVQNAWNSTDPQTLQQLYSFISQQQICSGNPGQPAGSPGASTPPPPPGSSQEGGSPPPPPPGGASPPSPSSQEGVGSSSPPPPPPSRSQEVSTPLPQ